MDNYDIFQDEAFGEQATFAILEALEGLPQVRTFIPTSVFALTRQDASTIRVDGTGLVAWSDGRRREGRLRGLLTPLDLGEETLFVVEDLSFRPFIDI